MPISAGEISNLPIGMCQEAEFRTVVVPHAIVELLARQGWPACDPVRRTGNAETVLFDDQLPCRDCRSFRRIAARWISKIEDDERPALADHAPCTAKDGFVSSNGIHLDETDAARCRDHIIESDDR